MEDGGRLAGFWRETGWRLAGGWREVGGRSAGEWRETGGKVGGRLVGGWRAAGGRSEEGCLEASGGLARGWKFGLGSENHPNDEDIRNLLRIWVSRAAQMAETYVYKGRPNDVDSGKLQGIGAPDSFRR